MNIVVKPNYEELNKTAGSEWSVGHNKQVREILKPVNWNDWELQENPRLLFELARLFVDSSKTLANASLFPHAMIGYLAQAVDLVDFVYQGKNRKSTILRSERLRDQAKVAEAMAGLFLGEKNQKLLRKSLAQYEQAGRVKPSSEADSGPILAQIEAELFKHDHGMGEPKWDLVTNNYAELWRIHDPTKKNSNNHRLATVGMWLVTRGEEVGNRELVNIGQDGFDKSIANSREKREGLALSIKQERKRQGLKRLKTAVTRILSLSVSHKTKSDLHQRIIKWESSGDLVE